MCAKYEIIYHKELNMFNCFCGYMGLFYHCTRKINGSINVVSCPSDCKLCEKEAERKNIILFVGKLMKTVIVFAELVFRK